MDRKHLIHEQLERAFRGPSWHGPALGELLAGVSAEQALARPLPGAHTIAELAAHAAAWKSVVAGWARGGERRPVSEAEDWPQPGPWTETLEGLEREHVALLDAVGALDEARLDRRLGDDLTLGAALFGVATHDLYHAGQIALLRRAGG